MKITRGLSILAILALFGGMAVPGDALARGGGGKGGGGRGGGGRGGKGKRGGDGKKMDRKALIAQTEEEMRAGDREDRLTDGRKDNFDDGQRERRGEVLARQRHRIEDARRASDARTEAAR